MGEEQKKVRISQLSERIDAEGGQQMNIEENSNANK